MTSHVSNPVYVVYNIYGSTVPAWYPRDQALIVLVSSPDPTLSRGKGSCIEHFHGLADSAVLISDVPIRTLPCDTLRNNHCARGGEPGHEATGS